MTMRRSPAVVYLTVIVSLALLSIQTILAPDIVQRQNARSHTGWQSITSLPGPGMSGCGIAVSRVVGVYYVSLNTSGLGTSQPSRIILKYKTADPLSWREFQERSAVHYLHCPPPY